MREREREYEERGYGPRGGGGGVRRSPPLGYAQYSHGARGRGGGGGYYGGGGGDQQYQQQQYHHHLAPPQRGTGFVPGDRRRHADGGRRHNESELLTYKQFMSQLSDDVEPDVAKEQYERYKNDYYMSHRAEYFLKVKNDEEVRARYHPQNVQELIERRAARAVSAAAAFVEELRAGRLVTGAVQRKAGGRPGGGGDVGTADAVGSGDGAERAGSDVGAMNVDGEKKEEEEEEGNEERKREAGVGDHGGNERDDFREDLVPAFAWSRERAAKDLAQARALVRTLDEEKRIADNPLLSDVGRDAGGGANGTHEHPHGGADAAEDAAGTGNGDHETDDAMAAGGGGGGGAKSIASTATTEALDLLLEWLWRVHRVDYYDGFESIDDNEVSPLSIRTVRPLRPDADSDLGAMDARGGSKVSFSFRSIDDGWRSRCRDGDPLREKLQQERQDRALDVCISRSSSEVTDKDGKVYWRCMVCMKMFRAKEFVVKHFKNKHVEALDEERARIHEKIFEDNFIKFEKLPGEGERATPHGGPPFAPGAHAMMMGHPMPPMPYGGGGPMMMMGGPMYPPPPHPFNAHMGFPGSQPPGFGDFGGGGGGRDRPRPRPKPKPVNHMIQAAREKARLLQSSSTQIGEEKADPRSMEQYNDLDSIGDIQEDAPLEYRLL